MQDCSLQVSQAIMETRGRRKQLKSADRARAVGARFSDFIISTWGFFGPGAREAWQDIVRRLAAGKVGEDRTTYIAELHQGLSHALMAGVGKQLLFLQFAKEPGYMEAADTNPESPATPAHHCTMGHAPPNTPVTPTDPSHQRCTQRRTPALLL